MIYTIALLMASLPTPLEDVSRVDRITADHSTDELVWLWHRCERKQNGNIKWIPVTFFADKASYPRYDWLSGNWYQYIYQNNTVRRVESTQFVDEWLVK